MDTIFICLIIVISAWAFKQHISNISKAAKHNKILGLRKPGKHDFFEKKSCDQFRKECEKNSIEVSYNNMPNLCTYLRILERKGMHLELVKDGLVRYKVSPDEKYIGSPVWQNEWSHIVFSPEIEAEDFCDCIRIIMHTHGLDAASIKDLSEFKGNDGQIKSTDSFFIYRALHIMHYHILIRTNDPALKKYELKKMKQMIGMVGCPVEEIYESKPLSELAHVVAGEHVCDSEIKTAGNFPPIIYVDNILSRPSGLLCFRGGIKIDADHIVLRLTNPFDMNIWDTAAVIEEDIAGIEVNTHIINVEYLFLFLKLIFSKLKSNGADKVKVEDLKKLDIIIVPSHIQREIIEKGMPVMDDSEQLEAVFSSYNEVYPLLRLVSR